MRASSAGVKVTRDDHRRGDADRGGDAHEPEERYAGDVEREQRDHDGGAGEDDGVTGRPVSQADRLMQIDPGPQLSTVPVEDEQRVVDPDGQAEHKAQHRGDRDHLDRPGQGQGDHDPERDADEGAEDREPGRKEGSEHDE